MVNSYVRASVCLSVREHIYGTAGPIFTKFLVQIRCGRDSNLLLWRCATLCTSGFMDDVTFGRNGRDAKMWRLLHRAATAMSGVVIPRRSLMSMNACCSSGLANFLGRPTYHPVGAPMFYCDSSSFSFLPANLRAR